TVVAGRSDPALDELVGFFVNTLVLRTDVSGNPTFAELLARVRDADLAAYAHQELPFDLLVEAVNPVRSPGRHPLFQVMLVMAAGAAGASFPGLTAEAVPAGTGTAKFDLSLAVRETPTGIDGVLEFDTDLFDRSTVERM